MKQIMSAVLLGIMGLCMSASSSLANSFPEAAVSSARTFATIVDRGDLQGAYLKASQLMRMVQDEQDWIKSVERSQRLLGPVQKRTLKAIRAVSTFPRLPDGEYLIVQYDAQTRYKDKAAEVILVEWQNTAWVVCSYSIR